MWFCNSDKCSSRASISLAKPPRSFACLSGVDLNSPSLFVWKQYEAENLSKWAWLAHEELDCPLPCTCIVGDQHSLYTDVNYCTVYICAKWMPIPYYLVLVCIPSTFTPRGEAGNTDHRAAENKVWNFWQCCPRHNDLILIRCKNEIAHAEKWAKFCWVFLMGILAWVLICLSLDCLHLSIEIQVGDLIMG